MKHPAAAPPVKQALKRGVETSGRLLDASAQASKKQARRRAKSWRKKAVFIAQCAAAAGVAYSIARYLFDVPVPLFAPVAAIITLGMTYGQRLARALEITVGVAVGVFVGELFVQWFGIGPWQVVVIVSVAMSIAAVVGAGALMVTQAGVQGLVVALLAAAPNSALGRWFEAVIGCAVALLFASIVPTSVVLRPRRQAVSVMDTLADLLRDSAAAAREGDRDQAEKVLERARRSERELTALRGYSADGVEVSKFSPFHRHRRGDVAEIVDLLEPTDRAVRNARVLIRRTTIALQTDEQISSRYVDMVAELAHAVGEVADWLHSADGVHSADGLHSTDGLNSTDGVHSADGAHGDADATPVVQALLAVGAASAHPDPHPPLSAEVIRAQVRSILVDLLMVLGWSFTDAQMEVRRTEHTAPR